MLLKINNKTVTVHQQDTYKLRAILIGQEQYNYFVILCKNVYFRAEICNFVQSQSQS